MTTPWRKRPLGCTRPNAPAAGRRSAMAPSAPWPAWRRPPAPGCTGTTPKGSCTAWAAGHPPKPKPGTGRGRNTWLDMGPARRAATGPGRQRIKDPARRPARLRPSAPCQATYTLEGGRPGNLTTAAATRRNCTHETRCARNSGCSSLPGVEERDRRGLGGGSFSVLPLDIQIVARISELGWHPHTPDVALEARRPDKVGDAPHALTASQGWPRLGDLEEGGITGGHRCRRACR